jgi:hypothetical protein
MFAKECGVVLISSILHKPIRELALQAVVAKQFHAPQRRGLRQSKIAAIKRLLKSLRSFAMTVSSEMNSAGAVAILGMTAA